MTHLSRLQLDSYYPPSSSLSLSRVLVFTLVLLVVLRVHVSCYPIFSVSLHLSVFLLPRSVLSAYSAPLDDGFCTNPCSLSDPTHRRFAFLLPVYSISPTFLPPVGRVLGFVTVAVHFSHPPLTATCSPIPSSNSSVDHNHTPRNVRLGLSSCRISHPPPTLILASTPIIPHIPYPLVSGTLQFLSFHFS